MKVTKNTRFEDFLIAKGYRYQVTKNNPDKTGWTKKGVKASTRELVVLLTEFLKELRRAKE